MRDNEVINEPFYKELYEMCNNGSAWIIHNAAKKIASLGFLNKSKLGKKIKLYVDTIGKAILTDEGGKYALPLMMTLAYFILPFDAVPDMLLPIGLIDDLGVLTTGYMISKKLMKASRSCGS